MRRRFVPECSGLELRLSLSVAGATAPATTPPAETAPATPTNDDPGDTGIKPYPTSGGSGGTTGQ